MAEDQDEQPEATGPQLTGDEAAAQAQADYGADSIKVLKGLDAGG